MRTRLFLRTSEFLWQEGHTAHVDEADARAETMRMLEVYRAHSEDVLAMPVIAGEKPENERFPGAVATYSIEAMMQDGKALQAGTSHYLGQNFAHSQNIRYQSAAGELEYCHTTSWGVSTRLIGGVIMTHGDDDGLRLPPAIAPRQIVIVPILRDKPEDAEVLAYGEALAKALNAQTTLGERVRALLDTRGARSADKRWEWVRRGAPIIVEVGPRDAAAGPGDLHAPRPPARRREDRLPCRAARRLHRRRAWNPRRDPGQPLRRRQGSARRQYPVAISAASRRWLSISAPRSTRTRAASSKAGCARPGRAQPARRWRRSTSG